jgi:hypothetical protein
MRRGPREPGGHLDDGALDLRRERRALKRGSKLGAILAIALVSAVAEAQLPLGMDVHSFKFVPRESGKTNYYNVVEDAAHGAFIHANYQPPYETAVLGYEIQSDADRDAARVLKWSWRAIALPNGGNECAAGKQDSAAVVYVFWKRGLKYYSIKYVWSGVGPKGAVCDKHRNPFVAQDTVILETGGPLNTWVNEEIDLKAEFRKHFEDNDPNADVPAVRGVGIMSDGDQTQSPSIADYGPFSVQ